MDNKRSISGALATGFQLRTIVGSTGENVEHLAINGDGSVVVMACGKMVETWDVRTGMLIQRFPHDRKVVKVAINADATRIVTATGYVMTWRFAGQYRMDVGDKVSVWNSDGSLRMALRGTAIFDINSSGSHVLRWIKGHGIGIWDTSTSSERAHSIATSWENIDLSDRWPYVNIVISGDGSRFATYVGDEVAIYGVRNPNLIKKFELERHRFSGLNADGTSIIVHPVSSQLSTRSDPSLVEMWSVTTDSVTEYLEGHIGRVLGVQFSADGMRAVSSAANGTCKVWELGNNHSANGGPPEQGDGKWDRKNVVMSRNGERAMTWSYYNTVTIWEVETASVLGSSRNVRNAAISGDGNRVALQFREDGSTDWGHYEIWDMETGAVTQTCSASEYGGLAISDDGRRILFGEKRGIEIWNGETGTRLCKLKGRYSSRVFNNTSTLSADGKVAVVDLGVKVVVWNGETGDMMWKLTGHEGHVKLVTTSEKGNLVATTADEAAGTVRIWSMADGTVIHKLEQSYSVAMVIFDHNELGISIAGKIDHLGCREVEMYALRNQGGHLDHSNKFAVQIPSQHRRGRIPWKFRWNRQSMTSGRNADTIEGGNAEGVTSAEPGGKVGFPMWDHAVCVDEEGWVRRVRDNQDGLILGWLPANHRPSPSTYSYHHQRIFGKDEVVATFNDWAGATFIRGWQLPL
ncbi:hypothetical protein HDV00_010669 [Rhizophlyctis rosea]|nr:hypothetical protein HDV00_010669 [Rhizophlyctis rosea]